MTLPPCATNAQTVPITNDELTLNFISAPFPLNVAYLLKQFCVQAKSVPASAFDTGQFCLAFSAMFLKCRVVDAGNVSLGPSSIDVMENPSPTFHANAGIRRHLHVSRYSRARSVLKLIRRLSRSFRPTAISPTKKFSVAADMIKHAHLNVPIIGVGRPAIRMRNI